MKIIKKTISFIDKYREKKYKKDINLLLSYLKELKNLESNLWGVTIKHLQNGEEDILENTNHLIYLISRFENQEHSKKLNKILIEKEFEEFKKDLKLLKEDFNYLKKKILNKNILKSLISNFTIKLVVPENYERMENIFLLEKRLYDIIEEQDEELNKLIEEVSKIKIKDIDEKLEISLKYLKKIRFILSGHNDLHYLWNKERLGFSETSNIIHELIKIVTNTLKEK